MIYECNAKRWKGKIYLPEWMSWQSMVRWEHAVDEARKLGEGVNISDFYDKLLPVALTFVEKFEIAGLPEHVEYEKFPASPKLVASLIEAVTELYRITNEDDAPK